MQAKRPGQIEVPLIGKIFQFRPAGASSLLMQKYFGQPTRRPDVVWAWSMKAMQSEESDS